MPRQLMADQMFCAKHTRLSVLQVGPGFARSHHSAGPAAQAPPSAGPSRKQSCPAVSRRSMSRATRCRHHHHSRAAAAQRLSPSYPAGFARQISCLARAHADDLEPGPAAACRTQALTPAEGNGALRKRPYLANRADDKVYAQQSGALHSIVVAHDLRQVSRAARSRALSSPNLREASRAAPRDSRLLPGHCHRRDAERETLGHLCTCNADGYHSVVAAFVRRARMSAPAERVVIRPG
eukprot:scaffold818_cov64-Phaeocystis_antarctica.AAC.18